MDPKLRRTYYNRCKPNEVLEPDDPRYVDLDSLGTPEARVRGVSWVEKLATQIELSDEPVCQLFTGLPGSGKSTELKRLARRLQDEAGANLFPVVISAEEVFDLANPIDIPDIIIAILHGADAALLQAEGKSSAAAMKEGYTRRLWNWLSKTDVALSGAEFAVADAANLTVELKTRPSLRQRVRATLATYLSQFLKEAADELLLMQARAVDLGKTGLVIIFDSLEKLRGIGPCALYDSPSAQLSQALRACALHPHDQAARPQRDAVSARLRGCERAHYSSSPRRGLVRDLRADGIPAADR
jgi:hypothetical protein